MENQDLVTICTVNNPTEAELIRGALQAVGISCTIGGENQAGFAGVFEIDVQTSAEDAAKAKDHLRLLRREKKERKHQQMEKRKAKRAAHESEAIQELKPTPPSTDIQEKPQE